MPGGTVPAIGPVAVGLGCYITKLLPPDWAKVGTAEVVQPGCKTTGNAKMEIEIRVADKKDIEDLKDLYQQLVEHEYSLHLPYKDMLKPFSDRLSDMLTRLDNLGTVKDTWFVACVENKSIGSVRVRKVTPFQLDREVAEILDVVVDKNFRNRGVGSRLMLHAFQLGKG